MQQGVMARVAGLARRDGGNVGIIFSLSLTVLLLGAGAGVDFGRWINARTATQSALDNAVLAGARALQLNPADVAAALGVARSYYQTNVEKRISVLSDNVAFSSTDSDTAVVATGNVTIKTLLLGLANVQSLPLFSNAESQIAKATTAVGGNYGGNIEVALMLDVTGSMCDDRVGPCSNGAKIDALKTAANDLVNIVVAGDQSKYLSRVALVPFSTRVRVGPDGAGQTMMKTLTNLDATWGGWYNMCTDWVSSTNGGSETAGNGVCNAYSVQQVAGWQVMPCVTDRFYDATWSFDATDDAPGAGKWLNGHGGDRMTLATDSSNTAAASKVGLTSTDAADHWNFNSGGVCEDIDPADEVMPLTSNKAALQARINGLRAYGSTGGALGTAWTWYALSPTWSGVWNTGLSASGNTPAPYGDLATVQANGQRKLRKVAVLMTDGGYNTYRGWKDESQQQVSDYATQLCTNMKAKGIEVFTVGFALDQLTAGEQIIARATLKSCGSDVSHFYETMTAVQLQQAFRDIAVKLSALYLSK